MTNDELSIKVAELRGDRDKLPDMEEYIDTSEDGTRTAVYPPLRKWKPNRYATDMNEAWKLVEEADTWEMHRDANNPEMIICTLVFNMTPFRASARSQSRAICKAFIKMKENDNV